LALTTAAVVSNGTSAPVTSVIAGAVSLRVVVSGGWNVSVGFGWTEGHEEKVRGIEGGVPSRRGRLRGRARARARGRKKRGRMVGFTVGG